MKTSSKNRAFTLLEIMIAMAIFAVVVAAIYSTWTAIVRGAKVGSEAAAAAQRSRVAIHTIEDALLTTQLYTENSRYYNFIADTSDPKFAWLSLTARLPADFPGSGLFGDQVVRRVTFAVQPGTDGTNELVMSQIPYLLVTNSDVSEYPITLARDVSLFVLEFWDTNINDWAEELQTTNQIPKMVRVTLGIGNTSGFSQRPSEVVSRVIALPSVAVGADIQRPMRQGGGVRGGGNGGIGNGGRGSGEGRGNGGKNGNNRNNGTFTPGGPGGFGNPRGIPPKFPGGTRR